jgi:Rubisco accumulation factor 1 alpha helical domain/Rubisco Assembly chaperone C-terminal domain/Rubisco accumulation factor 1 helix turn helix domain
MTESSTLSQEEISKLISSLLQKQGTWVDWGRSCKILQKAGYGAVQIFEETGFQASQQNLIMVAASVYDSLEKYQASEDILRYYQGPKSDILHELRILNQENRLAAAEVAKQKSLELDEVHDMAKAFQEFCLISQLPEGFTKTPGDAVAYQCWKRARQKKDLQERSRLIAKGLRFAASPSARELLERLLIDFTVVTSKSAPLLPVYRLEQEEQMSRIVPLLATKEEFKTVSSPERKEPFGVVSVNLSGSFVSLPGWPVIIKASDPVALLFNFQELPQKSSSKSEIVLVVVDRSSVDWEDKSYFLSEVDGNMQIAWYAESPPNSILGKLLLVLRPKNILDEDNITQPWQMDD